MLVLSDYQELSSLLSDIDGEMPDNITFFTKAVQWDLCDSFLKECGKALRDEIGDEVLDTDEITQLLANVLEDVSFSSELLRAHLETTAHAEAAKYINDMLGQVDAS